MYSLIGFSGKMRSGKDSAGKYLAEKYGYNRIGLADAVKDAYYALNPWVIIENDLAAKWNLPNGSARTIQLHKIQTVVDAVGWDEAKKAKEVREGLQRMGTEAGRNIHGEDCWLRIADRKRTGKDYISDIRFPNEAGWCREREGIVANLARETGIENEHASELGLCSEYYDVNIDNNTNNIEDLYKEIDKILHG